MENSSLDTHSRPFSNRWLGRLLFCLVFLATLIGLFYAVENWRGKRAWDNYKREWEAKGERFDLAAFVPAPVPDDQNFTTTPLLKPLLDYESPPGQATFWRDKNGFDRLQQLDATTGEKKLPRVVAIQMSRRIDLPAWQRFYRDNTNFPQASQPQSAAADMLLALSKFDPVITELRTAAARPCNRFPVHYDDEDPYQILLPHLAVLKKLAVILQLRAVAHLESGHSAQASHEVNLGFHLADAVKSEPLLISHLIRIANQAIILQDVKEGLVRHSWSEEQLVEFQKYLADINLLTECATAMRGERAFSIKTIERLRQGHYQNLPTESEAGLWELLFRFFPNGWFYQSQLVICRFHQEHNLTALDAQAQRVNTGVFDGVDAAINRMKTTPFTVLAKMLLPAVSKAVPKTARAQTAVNQALVACALERFRLVHGQFPETLAVLMPRFIDKLPHDVINGQPLKYQRRDDGQFVLYSVGWNEEDDGGTIGFTKNSEGVDFLRGDWVW